MTVSEEEVELKKQAIILEQSEMLDGSNLKKQFQSLQRKIYELRNYWNTSSSEEEIAKYEEIIHDLQLFPDSSRIIHSIKQAKPNANKVIKSITYF